MLKLNKNITLEESRMPNNAGQKGRFEPIHEAHAIEQVLFSLQFNNLLNETGYQELIEAADQFKGDMPVRIETQGVTFPFLPGANPIPNSGFILRRTSEAGQPIEELRIDHNSINFWTTSYLRWDSIWARLSQYYKALVPIYLKQARMAGFVVNYVDKFAWVGDVTECRVTTLLRDKSKYLSPHVYEAEDFWHSHTGAFIKIGKDTRRLLNVNVDHFDEIRTEGVRRIVSITTVLSDQMDQVGYDQYVIENDDINGFIDAHMQELHTLSKEILGDIINNEMCKRIALKG